MADNSTVTIQDVVTVHEDLGMQATRRVENIRDPNKEPAMQRPAPQSGMPKAKAEAKSLRWYEGYRAGYFC